ncbi:cyclin dependent kinase binding protein, putative [Plasmodium berghei ANKA]|uniref:Cyclin dependent kinase binding protein, putative n=1 Tax=Plasmodium berghei (strain Anka) TaxID=5823 RepID=A0A509ADQ9_PLABA|nr:cyclin dependent kinase binding protein, putative [Plasmodium berghei ANKA]VUC53778.1 cyclin dependent kinase binding protein, putative [Plasmodium berghei ANKA]|eukprot:XP_034419642.1 cyclin dependent kinase binding protein, putative [Plasmodium berghei ANKA]
MKNGDYFNVYNEFFKDAYTFLNTIIETKRDCGEISSSSESGSEEKKKIKNKKYINENNISKVCDKTEDNTKKENKKYIYFYLSTYDKDKYLNDNVSTQYIKKNKYMYKRSNSRTIHGINNDENCEGNNHIPNNIRINVRNFNNNSSTSLSQNEYDIKKKDYTEHSIMNRGIPKILMSYKNDYNICLSYNISPDNVWNDINIMNYKIPSYKKGGNIYGETGSDIDHESMKEEYNIKKKDQKNMFSFLYKWILSNTIQKIEKNELINYTNKKKLQIQYRNKQITNEYTNTIIDFHENKDDILENGNYKNSHNLSSNSYYLDSYEYNYNNLNFDKDNFYNDKNTNRDIFEENKKDIEKICKKNNFSFNNTKKMKKKKKNKGISYEHLLTPSKYEYDAFCLFNPRFKQGKHHTVLCLQSYNVSIIPFVQPKKLKEEVNELFSEINPWIHKSLTLSKLRNLKIDLFNLINHIPEIDISTISCAWVFFERLVIKGYVHKGNRKLYAATCLILSLKFYQHDDIHILEKLLIYIQKLDKKENLTPSLIFSMEFTLYKLLDFSLQHTYENIRLHIHQYLESKELKFEDVYGTSEDTYLVQMENAS